MYTPLLHFIPKDKYDVSVIPEIKNLKPSEISLIAPSLLEWLADINWPVAIPLAEELVRFHKELIPAIKHILYKDNTDNIWKYWIISILVNKFPIESILLLKEELLEISGLIIKDVDDELLKEIAVEIIKKF